MAALARGRAPLRSRHAVIWRDPGRWLSAISRPGPGRTASAALPPSSRNTTTGSQPCLSVRDARGREWRVKWGAEVHTETFGTRLAWALGYFAEPTYFVAVGTIEGAQRSAAREGTASTSRTASPTPASS